jgi:hypothetical protein
MKLPIKDEHYKRIISGQKCIDIRDAHITFINEKTGERIRKQISGASVRRKTDMIVRKTVEKYPDCFDPEDPEVIVFYFYD